MSRGSQDYTLDIYRAAIYALYNLKSNEIFTLLGLCCSDTASAYGFVKSPIASGDSAHIVNMTTGVDTPYTIPAGYEFIWLMTLYSINQPTLVQILLDTYLYVEYYPLPDSTYYDNYVIPFRISMVDPTLASAHLFDVTLKNLGALDLKGTAILSTVMEAVGTPPIPKTKTVKCKWNCPGSAEVPVNTTRWTCPICGKETWFYGRKVI